MITQIQNYPEVMLEIGIRNPSAGGREIDRSAVPATPAGSTRYYPLPLTSTSNATVEGVHRLNGRFCAKSKTVE